MLLPGASLLTAVSAWAEGMTQRQGDSAVSPIVHLYYRAVVTAGRAQQTEHPFSLLVLA